MASRLARLRHDLPGDARVSISLPDADLLATGGLNDPARHHLAVAAVEEDDSLRRPRQRRVHDHQTTTRSLAPHASEQGRRPPRLAAARRRAAGRQRRRGRRPRRRRRTARSTILVISCQGELARSTTTTATRRRCRRGGFGPPRGYTQPDAAGVGHAPFELTALRSVDPPHGWRRRPRAVQRRQDGRLLQAPRCARGRQQRDPVLHRARSCRSTTASSATPALCANYFCSLLGPTWPNRFYLMSGTSGGITTNGLWGYGIFDSATWPIILDLLDDADVSWKIYYIGFDGVEVGDTDNVAVFWSRWAHDPRTTATLDDYLEDCRRGTLPNVSWIIPSFSMQFDEHPDADVSVGMGFQEQIITALRRSRLWQRVGVLPHLRRARRLLRPRPAAADRCVRPRHPRAALGRSRRSHGAVRSSRASRPITSRR